MWNDNWGHEKPFIADSVFFLQRVMSYFISIDVQQWHMSQVFNDSFIVYFYDKCYIFIWKYIKYDLITFYAYYTNYIMATVRFLDRKVLRCQIRSDKSMKNI